MDRTALELDSSGFESDASHWQHESNICGCVSLEAEVPEILFEGMRHFIQLNPDWDQYSVITSALAGFLFQNGCQDQIVTQHYLNALFPRG